MSSWGSVTELVITVAGAAAPQGSKRAFAVRGKGGAPTGRVAVIESSHDRVKSWRQAVIDEVRAADAARGTGLTFARGLPLQVDMVFCFKRPKSHYRTGRNAHLLRDDAPAYPSGKPDLSKLARATEDALTDAGLWADDAQVVEYGRLAKTYAGSGGMSVPGVIITVRPLGGRDSD
jgi:Holliday junction resolvase RusA-like endonuclease